MRPRFQIRKVALNYSTLFFRIPGTAIKQFSGTSPSDVISVLRRKWNTVSYSKTGQENGQDSQKAFADDNNHLTDGEGPNNLNQD